MRHLEAAERHVEQGARCVMRQRCIVDALERQGHDKVARIARDLLSAFEQSQAAHVWGRDRLLCELDQIEPP